MLTRVSKNIKFYGKETNLHGIRYIADENSNGVVRIIWTIIVILSFYGMMRIFKGSFEAYTHNAISFVTETAYLDWNTTFPSVSVCEITSTEVFWTESPNSSYSPVQQFITDIVFFTGSCYSCLTPCDDCKRINFQEIVKQYRKKCSGLLGQCRWNGQLFNCCDVFEPINTEYGICFALNSMHAKKTTKFKVDTNSNRKTGPGELMIEAVDDVRLYFHAPEDVPFINSDPDQRKDVMLGEAYNIMFKVTEIENDENVAYISVDKRGCRFPKEKPDNLLVHDYYSYSTCVVQCHADAHLEFCNCTHHLMPVLGRYKTCDIEGLKCLTENFETVNRLHAKGFDKPGLVCECVPSCIEPEYKVVSDRKGVKTPYSEILIKMQSLPTTRFRRNVVRTTMDLVVRKGVGDVNQDWGYVDVRPGAHMFWWLYYTTANVSHYSERPLIIWLQGGPGMAASGYGNFIEIGPYNLHMKTRKRTWIKNYNVLFIDSPIGAGFSYYSDENSELLKSTDAIAQDLIRFFKIFIKKDESLQEIPIYIFGESYGGKIATEFAYQLQKEIKNGVMRANLRGIGLGDAYTSPIDYVLNYAPFALTIGLIDKQGYKIIDDLAQQTQKAVDKGQYEEAFDLEVNLTNTLVQLTKGVDVYNIVIKSNATSSPKLMSYEKKCNKFMNSLVKRALDIPEEVRWLYTNRDIYNAMDGDIMRPVMDRIEYILNNTDIKVIVYNGIFDFIVNTSGTLSWLDKLRWIGAPLWHNTSQEALEINMINEGYVRRAANLIFYIVLRAGHSVPVDNVIAMEEILRLELLDGGA